MRVMVFVKSTEEAEKESWPKEWMAGMMEAMGKFNDELRDAGILHMAEGLTPTSRCKRVTFNGSRRTVTDGPFAETHELVARCPNPMPGPSDIEIRPFYQLDDLP